MVGDWSISNNFKRFREETDFGGPNKSDKMLDMDVDELWFPKSINDLDHFQVEIIKFNFFLKLYHLIT